MAVLVDMPKLGVNMTKGVVVKWLADEGSAVKAGQPLFEVETDKVVQEVEAAASGVLARIIAHENDEVPCTKIIAVITAPGEPLPAEIPEMMPGAEQPESEIEVRVPREAQATAAAKAAATERKRIPITPLARKLAREWDIDTSQIVPTGKRITKADIEAAHHAQQVASAAVAVPAPAVGTPIGIGAVREPRALPRTNVQRTTAERMNLSARTVARVGLSLEADAAELIAWRERLGSAGDEVGYNELLARIVAHALQEYPYMNAQLVGDELVEMPEVNVGIATDTERGLLVPVMRDANKKGVRQIAREFAQLVERAHASKSTLDDLSGGTFTITNLGMYEIEEFLPIVNLPECAILGVGAIVKKPAVVDEQLAIRPRMRFTLAFDHRLVDGAPAARFLQRIKQLVEDPLEILS